MVEKIIIFILFLCPLIFFHELGHFLFARLFGVRVEIFSIGFGPKIFKFFRNGTEYAISIIPLGGYIKMFGDDPLNEQPLSEEEKKFAFNYKSKWARFWIVFGGPFFNFILAYIIFILLLLSGEKLPQARFGNIDSSEPIYASGVRSGDILSMINDKKIEGITDFNFGDNEIVKSLVVQRKDLKNNSNLVNLTIPLDIPFKSLTEVLFKYPPQFRLPFVVDIRGNRHVVSLEKGKSDFNLSLEEITSYNPKKVYLYRFADVNLQPNEGEEKTKKLATSSPSKVGKSSSGEIEIPDYKIDYSVEKELSIDIEKETMLEKLRSVGYYPHDLQIDKVLGDSAADKGGLKNGDLIIGADDKPFYSFEQVRSHIQNLSMQNKEFILLKFIRNTEEKVLKISPDPVKEDGKSVFKLGVYSSIEFVAPIYVISTAHSFGESLILGFARTYDAFEKTVGGLKKLIFGEVSFKNVGGPITIGKVAADSYNIGLSYFFKIMAIISVNLAVINLFPIPVLDGGHILFIIFEFFNRGPLSRKKVEMAQRFGFSLLLLLIFASLFNDIARVLKIF